MEEEMFEHRQKTKERKREDVTVAGRRIREEIKCAKESV